MRFGVLGCAEIAWRRMLPALTGDPRVKVVAVASRDPARAARFAERFGGDPVDSYDALIARDDVDAVYLPLPPALHAPWIRRALLAGKHVLAEKPLATTLADAQELVNLAAARGLVLVENYMFLRHPVHHTVRELVAAGAVGELRTVSATFAIPPRPDDDFRYRPAAGGGALTDIGGYPLRAARLFLGPELGVVGAVLRVDEDRGVDLGGAALLTTPAGLTAQVVFGLEHAYRCCYELYGSAGRIVVDRAFTPPPDHAPVIRVESGGGVQEVRVEPADQFAAVVDAFVTAVHDGTDSGLQGEAVVRQATLVDAVRARARRIPLVSRPADRSGEEARR